MPTSSYLRLLRAEQWYKNLVVFFALFFIKGLFDLPLLSGVLLAFVSLCLLSSGCYVLNDIRDAPTDRRHPEKRKRPIAAGQVSTTEGYAISLILIAASLAVAYVLPFGFLACLLVLFTSNQAYNLGLRDVALVDIHLIAFNFLVRAIAGAVAIGVDASPWLVTTVFFSALLLGVGKRRTELAFLGLDAPKFRRSYEVYTKEMLDTILMVVSSILLFSYILYTFFVHAGGAMMATIPFASFSVFRFIHLTLAGDRSARKAHYLLVDRQIISAFALWGLTLFYLIYVLRV